MSRRRQSIFRQERSIRFPLQLWHQQQIAELMPLGIYHLIKFMYEFRELTLFTSFANGSLLIAALQPRFTILHNLSTSRGPSPIVSLAWHASSSRQKSDMLASQTNDGDLRVWSVAKSPTSSDTAKVVRVLKRSGSPENVQSGPNWLAWSKNGRIVQFSEG